MIKRLILLVMSVMTISVMKGNVMPIEKTYVDQYNSVMVQVPATIKYRYSEECSVKLRSHNHDLYKLLIVNDTLFIKPVSQQPEEIHQMQPRDCIVILRHPNKQILNEILIDKRILTKSGNPRK
jgi:hypothetical protein